MNIYEEDYLEHFGVKGMKWGVRRKGQVGGIAGLATHQLSKAGTQFLEKKGIKTSGGR